MCVMSTLITFPLSSLTSLTWLDISCVHNALLYITSINNVPYINKSIMVDGHLGMQVNTSIHKHSSAD